MFRKTPKANYSCDPVNISREFKKLHDYVFDLAFSIPAGISSAEVSHYSIAKWLNLKLKTYDDPDYHAITIAAGMAIWKTQTLSDVQLENFGEVLSLFYILSHQCNHWLDEARHKYQNLEVNPHGLPKSKSGDFLRSIVINTNLNEKKIKKRLFDCDMKRKVSYQTLLELTIAIWVTHNIQNQTWCMNWSDENLESVLSSAMTWNQQQSFFECPYESCCLDELIDFHFRVIARCTQTAQAYEGIPTKRNDCKINHMFFTLFNTMERLNSQPDEKEKKKQKRNDDDIELKPLPRLKN